MKNLKVYNLNLGTVILRFYFMMAVVIIAGFSGYWLIALLSLPIFMTIMMGVSFNTNEKTKKKSALINLKPTSKEEFPKVA